MSAYTLPYFGTLDSERLEDYYDTDFELNGKEVTLDLNFETTRIDTQRLEAVNQFISNLSNLNQQNLTYMQQDYADSPSGFVAWYIQYYLESFEEDLADSIDFSNTTVSPERQLLHSLRLERVGLYPDSDDHFAIFDYSIDSDLTNQILVVFINKAGEIDGISVES
jgi:hypothetical protein